MLTVNNTISNKSKINFGTNLVVDKSVTDRVNKHPEELKKIQDFKNYLATDGKDWNAELRYDTFTQTAPENKEKEIETLVRKSAKDFDYDAMESASLSISQMKPNEAAKLIKKLAKDPDSDIQKEAVRKIGEIKDSKIALNLVDEFAQNPNPTIKESAIRSLDDVEDSVAKNKMIEKFINSEDNTIRRAAVNVTYKMEDSKILTDSLEKFSKDSDSEIRMFAIYKISDMEKDEYNKNPKLYDSIIKNGLTDSDKKVKAAAMGAVGHISDSSEAVKLINESIENCDDRWQRSSIAGSAGNIQDPQVAKAIIEKLLTHPDKNVREGAAGAAMHINDDKIANEFIDKLIDSPDSDIRNRITWKVKRNKRPGKIDQGS